MNDSKRASVPDYISSSIESALAACGRERVMHKTHGLPSVAIRWDVDGKVTAPDGAERFLVRDGETLDEAGKAAASAFAQRIRQQARALIEWADRIEAHLKNWKAP